MASKAESRLSFSIDSIPTPEQETSNARCGTLAIQGRQEIKTPNFYAIASRGVVPHLTPDVLARHASIGGVYMALEDFIEAAAKKAPPILSCPARGSPPSRLHAFTALPTRLPTILAPRRLPAVAAPLGNSLVQISIFTSVGFQELSSKDYAMYARELSADLVVSMPDIPFGKVPGSKKRDKMGDRTKRWLADLTTLLNGDGDETPAIFAPVLPVSYQDQKDYLEEVIDGLASSKEDRQRIEGLAFYDASILPSLPATSIVTELPRLSLDMPQGPHEVLRQVSLGIDLFALPFVGQATDAGLALSFSFTNHAESGDSAVAPLARDMFSKDGSKDIRPLMESCKCYACTEHHSAYITHLLAAKEMLGWLLLQVHNHHVLSQFFDDIREAIVGGTFEGKMSAFQKRYESGLPMGTGEKPRVRGYHFKSEGPGEQKRNKRAWGQLGGEPDGPLVPHEAAEELESKGFAEVAS